MACQTTNELLCFLSSQYDTVDKDCLYSIASEFYTLDESNTAKKILIKECERLGLTDAIAKFTKRRQNAKGDGCEKVINDILDIWSVIDCQKAGLTVSTFVAADLSRLPSTSGADELNIQHLFNVISILQKQVSDIGNIVTRIDKKTDSDISAATPSALDDYFSTTIPSQEFSLRRSLPAPEVANKSRKRALDSSADPFIPSKQQRTEETPFSSTPMSVSPVTHN